ncbi:MAG: two-component system response regulator [Spirochaetae bacterium HGW-Spirochaetae-10]|jgi:two-component system chemotaxis response regulator CheY|nr:MAG: two-component system response regulator [Spirochaetae bacterium HGW-Spirochaetae-10]
MIEEKKILIVDDSTMMRTIIRGAFESIGLRNIVESSDGVDALKKLIGQDFDLIITDRNMPGMDGVTLVETVRSHSRYANVPILMVTTESEKETVIKALQKGVNGYIVKPFTPEILWQKALPLLRGE